MHIHIQSSPSIQTHKSAPVSSDQEQATKIIM